MKNWLFFALLATLPAFGADPALETPQFETTRGPVPAAIATRAYRVDRQLLLQLHPTEAVSTASLQQIVETFLHQNGLNFPEGSGKKAFYNDRTGVLWLHASPREHERVEQLLKIAGAKPPPQVRLETRMIESRSPALEKHLKVLQRLTPVTRQSLPGEIAQIAPNAPNPESADPIEEIGWLAVLTQSETTATLRVFEQREGFDLFSLPPVTTLSGRTARLAFEAGEGPITDPPFTAPGKTPKARWSSKE